MFHLKSSDFQTLSNPEILWRWTGTEGVILPEPVLAQIHELRPETAQQLAEEIDTICRKLSHYLFEAIPKDLSLQYPFSDVQRLQVGGQSQQSVRDWLISQEVPEDMTMLVGWEPTVVVAVPWKIFCWYWDDFSYPDDVCISSVSGIWHLLYYHEDIFLFGKLLHPFPKELPKISPLLPQGKEEVLRLLQENKKIEAIKLYHRLTGYNLKEAREAVNKLSKEL